MLASITRCLQIVRVASDSKVLEGEGGSRSATMAVSDSPVFQSIRKARTNAVKAGIYNEGLWRSQRQILTSARDAPAKPKEFRGGAYTADNQGAGGSACSSHEKESIHA